MPDTETKDPIAEEVKQDPSAEGDKPEATQEAAEKPVG